MRTTILFTALFLSVFSVSAEEIEVEIRCDDRFQKDGSTWYRVYDDIWNKSWYILNSPDGKFLLRLFSGKNTNSLMERVEVWNKDTVVSLTDVKARYYKLDGTMNGTLVKETAAVLVQKLPNEYFNNGNNDYGYYVTFTFNVDWPEPEPPPPPECTCGAGCIHCCTCGNFEGDCPGTPESCDCHAVPDCTCGAGCIHCCTCGNLTGSCPGTAEACDCHSGTETPGCTCGACCECECTCGNWPDLNPCVMTCEHACIGDLCQCKADTGLFTYTHCECHHHADTGDCCEHHEADYVPPPDIPGIGEFADPGEIHAPNMTNPDIPDGPKGPGLPTPPGGGIGEGANLPGSGVPNPYENSPLTWFERSAEEFGFPTFKYEELYDSVEEKIREKINLDWLDGLKNPASGGGVDLSWTVDFTWYNQRYGPWTFDFRDALDGYLKMQIARILRLIILFFVCAVFLMSVLDLVFVSRN